jgi:uncharacterized protein YndB with AHSA1/START domain
MLRYESFIEIDAPVEFVFDMLADFERYPRWMGGVRDVRRTGKRTTHWIAETALDVDVEWDAETTVFNPDRRIVWRSFRGDIHADGEAVLAQTERGTTVLHYVLGYDTPAGRSGERAAQFFGEHPLRRLERDLARFKRLAERVSAGQDDVSFVPRSRDVRPRADNRQGGSREDARRRAEDRGGWGFEEIQRRHRRRDESDERERGDGYERNRVRDERGQNHGSDERERGRERDGQQRVSGRAGREPDRMRRMTASPREREDGREREAQEREERRGYGPGWFERRGVDHLLDEPPSRHWRR